MADYTLSIKIGASLSPKTLSTLQTLKTNLKTLKLSSENALKEFEEKLSRPWELPKVEAKEFLKDFTAFKTYTSTVHQLIKKFKELREQGKENTKAFENLSYALKRLGVNTSYINEEVRRLSYTLRKLRQVSKIELKIQAQKERLQSQISSLKSAIAVGASLALPIKIGMDFEAQIVRVKALAGATKEEFKALKEKAKQLGATTKYSATEVAQAFEYMVMAGMKTKDILTSAEDVLNLATIGNLDLAQASDIATNIMSGFGLKAKELSRVIDVMAKTITTSNTSVQELGETMKYVAPVASAVGASLEEVSAMAGLLGNVGIKGSQAGTTLRAMFLRLSAPTGEAAKALQMLGITTTDAQGKLKPMPILLKEIAKALKLLPQAQRMEVLKQIFGEEPAAGVQALLKAAETGELDKYIETVKNSKGSAKKMVDELNSTLKASITSLLSSLQTLAIEIFEPMKPYVKGFIDLLTFGVRTLTTVLKPIMPVLTPVLFVLGSAFVATKLLTLGITTLNLAKLMLNRQLLLTQARLATTTAGLKLFRLQTLLTAGGIRTLSRTLLTNPLGLFIFGLTLLIGHLDKVKEVLKGVKKGLSETFSFFSPLFSTFKPIINFVSFVSKKLLEFFGIVRKEGDEATNIFENLGYVIGKYVVPGLALLSFPLLKGIGLVKSFTSLIKAFPPLSLKVNFPNPVSLAKSFLVKLTKVFKAGIALPTKFPFSLGKLALFGIRAFSMFSPLGLALTAGSFILPHLPKIVSAIGKAGSFIAEKGKAFIGKAFEFVKKGVSFTLKTFPIGLFASVVNAIKEKLKAKNTPKEITKEATVEVSKEYIQEKLLREQRTINVSIGTINITVQTQSIDELPEKIKQKLKPIFREIIEEALESKERDMRLAMP